MITRYADEFCKSNPSLSNKLFSTSEKYRAEVTCFEKNKNFIFHTKNPNDITLFLNKEYNQKWTDCRIFDDTGFCFLKYKNEFRWDAKNTKEYFVYVLQLKNNKFYIGSTVHLKNRLRQHFNQESEIKFIQENPVIGVHQILHTYNNDMQFKILFENFVAYQYLLIYGSKRVHGGDFLNDENNKLARIKSYGKTARSKKYKNEFQYIWNHLRSSFNFDFRL